ncbi:Hypothetical protein NTJ_00641 [Nesidiocoris tenuis]|nr:Hypothetical protein NTJ_00641 [Nesidiocoris tenuis]
MGDTPGLTLHKLIAALLSFIWSTYDPRAEDSCNGKLAIVRKIASNINIEVDEHQCFTSFLFYQRPSESEDFTGKQKR